jgi:hypothetical protein
VFIGIEESVTRTRNKNALDKKDESPFDKKDDSPFDKRSCFVASLSYPSRSDFSFAVKSAAVWSEAVTDQRLKQPPIICGAPPSDAALQSLTSAAVKLMLALFVR